MNHRKYNALSTHLVTYHFVNDHLRDEKKAAIFHAETGRFADTLSDHSVIAAQ